MIADTLAMVRKKRLVRVVHIGTEDFMFEFLRLAIRQKYENVTFVAFKDGDLARRELLREEPDLLITTISRENGLDGYDLVSRLAAEKIKYPILVYDFLMDKAGEDHVHRLAGSDLNVSCLYCPFTVEQFLQALSKAVG